MEKVNNMDIAKEKVFNGIISTFVDMLKSQPACAYEEHGDLFVDFGWDVAEGDGRICSSVNSLFKDYIDALPLTLLNWLWWQTYTGTLEEKYIFNAFETTPPYLGDLYTYADEDIDHIVDLLMDKLRPMAESAFSDYEESEY